MSALSAVRRHCSRSQRHLFVRTSLAVLVAVCLVFVNRNHLFVSQSSASIGLLNSDLRIPRDSALHAELRDSGGAESAVRRRTSTLYFNASHPTPALKTVAQRWFPDFAKLAGVQCSQLLNGSADEVRKAALYARANRRKFRCQGDRALSRATCAELAAAGYSTGPAAATAEEAAFPIAFGLRMHTCAAQAELLLRAIYAPQNVYCVHIDGSAAPAVVAAMRNVVGCFSNVLLAPLDDDFVYASVSQLKADLTCMRLLVASPVRWRYFINVAGQELPLRTNGELVRLLRAYNGSNEIKSTYQSVYRYRYASSFWCADPLTNKTIPCERPRVVKRPPPGNVPVLKGLAYGFFSRPFVDYALAESGPGPSLYEWFKDTYAPEEHYFATLVRLSGVPGGYDRAGHALPTSRAVSWLGGRRKCRGRYVRQVCVYGVGDLQWLSEQPQAFANKLRYDYDPVALQCLAESVLNRTLGYAAPPRPPRAAPLSGDDLLIGSSDYGLAAAAELESESLGVAILSDSAAAPAAS